MSQKADRRSTSPAGCRRSTQKSRGAFRGSSFRGFVVYRSILGSTGSRKTPRSRRLVGSFAGSLSPETHVAKNRTRSAAVAKMAEGTKRVGRIRSAGHPPRNAGPRDSAMSRDSYNQPHSATAWRLGWTLTRAPAATVERLVSRRRGRAKVRTGQLRHHRRLGDRRRLGSDRFDGSFAAWRADCGVDGAGRQRENRGGTSGGTLARRGTSRLRPVRQRHAFSRAASVHRYDWTCDAAVFEPGSRSRVRSSQRNRFPGGHRKFQRTVAIQGLVAIQAHFASWLGWAFRQVHCRFPKTPRPPHRVGAGPASLSQTLATRPAKTSDWHNYLFASHRQPGPCQRLGTLLYRRSKLASPVGSHRRRFEPEEYPLLCLATTRSNQSTSPEGSPVHTSPTAIS